MGTLKTKLILDYLSSFEDASEILQKATNILPVLYVDMASFPPTKGDDQAGFR